MSYEDTHVDTLHDDTVDLQNEAKTGSNMSTPEAQDRSRPVRYRLMSPLGNPSGTFETAQEAAHTAGTYWPGMAQRDHDNGAAGWDIEVVR